MVRKILEIVRENLYTLVLFCVICLTFLSYFWEKRNDTLAPVFYILVEEGLSFPYLFLPILPIWIDARCSGFSCPHNSNKKHKNLCCCDSRSYCVRTVILHGYISLAGIAVVGRSIYLFTVSSQSLLLMPISYIAVRSVLWLNGTSYSKNVWRSEWEMPS